MSFQRRFVGAVSVMTMGTLGGALMAISIAVNASQQRQLDEALRAEATEEAREASALGGDELAISDRPGPAANDVGPLTKYGAIFGPEGRVLAATPTFHGSPPPLETLGPGSMECFDLWFRGEHLRGVLVPIPAHAGTRLLLAAPRADLDGDASFLARAMLTVFFVAVGWSALLATWIVRRLTREHEAITLVARRVAAGDLSARVATRTGDAEIAQLGRDINEMIARLDVLVASQHRFIAQAAHEMRSPLTTLYGELSHALRKPRDADTYRRAIEEALEAARRLKLMTDDLLALARLGADVGDPSEPVDVLERARAAAEAVAWEARERDTQIDVRGEPATVLGHSRNLERLLRNLIENAVRHSPKGGRVEVVVEPRGDAIEAAVSDEGPGIPEAERVRVFEPFYRGVRERAGDMPGAGLGLPIARQIAQAHGGDVLFDATRTKGSRFVVRLPAAQEEVESDPPEGERAA
ncbi:sensor histidine kinase [Polyangium mundeleinium]|uniref:histidine kinase n=1 Tax=Polyangium mundeleinium TaxID=2995306 RepID=A0ABT5EXC9_9BACT|nr:HAMP domain-containing sensor histidine kinase [Polyangium mundeleinium]MDC0746049.1 HAMP domain-containing sensor histidine kinase [Polyangium mundeleinium]